LLVWVIVLGLLAGGGYYAWRYYQSTTEKSAARGAGRGAGRPLPVVAAESRRGDLPIYLDALGNVTAYNTVTLRTRVDGQLMHIHFSEGQLVHQGDLLFEIDPRPFQVQLTQAQGQLAKDQATLNNAKLDLARYEAAAEAISKQVVDTARAAVVSAEGTVKADQGAIDAANLNLVYTRITAPISGKIGLRVVDVGNMVHASDAAGLAVITQLQPISVTFSIAEDNLPQLQKAMSAAAASTAPSSAAVSTGPADATTLLVDAFDRDDRNRIATGRLEALDNQIDPATATVRLKAVFSNEDNALYPNQFVNVHLLVDTLRNVVLVPDAAVQRSPTSTFIYVATDTPPAKEGEAAEGGARAGGSGETQSAAPAGASAGRRGNRGGGKSATDAGGEPAAKPQYVEMRPVTVGPTQGRLTVIEKGLEADEVVITEGVDKLQPGTPVIVHLPDQVATRAAAAAGTQSAINPPSRRAGRGNRGSAATGGASGGPSRPAATPESSRP
jgi:multidrug efflux system membrane fusion protein